MSKLKFSKGKFARFISSKGFYAALAICLIGACAATWMAVDRTITGIENSNSRIIADDLGNQPYPLLEEVEQKQPDVPQERSSEAEKPAEEKAPLLWEQEPSSSTSSSSAEEQLKPSVQSGQSTDQPTSQKLTYALPIRGDVLNAFSSGELVKSLTLGDWRTHDGMDIYAEKGADICAAADGTVAEVRNDPLWGTVVVIDHADGNQTHYYGLSQNVPVQAGDSVAVRQSIGKLDNIPCEISEKSHLHFALRYDGIWVDPMTVLNSAAQ